MTAGIIADRIVDAVKANLEGRLSDDELTEIVAEAYAEAKRLGIDDVVVRLVYRRT